ncbi:hypothetical protein LSAT2_024542 [Lamellibrachia satsuma]|nr:hypothetical protein LSAT2_024542 [Lamellibrachia satsuma]
MGVTVRLLLLNCDINGKEIIFKLLISCTFWFAYARGTYQPTAGEVKCIKCSPGKSTTEEGTQNESQCKDVEVPSNSTFIIVGSVSGLVFLLLLSCILYTVYRRRSGHMKDTPDSQASQHHGNGDNPTQASVLQTSGTTSDIYEEIADERTVSVWPQTKHNNRTIMSTSGVNLKGSSPQQRSNTGVSPNPQAVGYGMTNQPVAEYQYLSQSDRVPVVPKVYASLVAIPSQTQSNAVYSPHSDANVLESEMTNHPATEYEGLSSEARVPVVHKVYASLKGSAHGDINT